MESFYRMMRKKHSVLFEDGEPTGGTWNYDSQNRKKWKGSPAIPKLTPTHSEDLSPILHEIQESGIRTIGQIDLHNFHWTITTGAGARPVGRILRKAVAALWGLPGCHAHG